MKSPSHYSFEKAPQADEPGASHGHAVDGHRRPAHLAVPSRNNPSGKFPGSVVPQERGRVVGKHPNNSSSIPALPPISRKELIRETQSIVLQFHIKEMAHWQDCTDKAVESQRDGEAAMSLRAAVNAARSNPRVRAMLGRLLGFTGHYADPDFMEGWEKMAMSAIARQHFANDQGEQSEEFEDATPDLFGGVH